MIEKHPLASIIVRTKNEERWIGSCLEGIFNQTYKNIEVVLVDNQSTDQTIKKASHYPIKLVTIENFLPGLAINQGVRASSGEYIVIISGHCIPVNEHWLSNLIANLQDGTVAGVYGRQEPLSFTSPLDKRDLAITFGLDKRIQQKDSFFHNANSALHREVWQQFPFNETVTNIEDRVWGDEVIHAGLKIIYEPDARVYHYHGIHQGRNIERAEKIVKIMENLNGLPQEFESQPLKHTRIIAIVPIKGEALHYQDQYLLRYTINYLLESQYITEVIVSTDDQATATLATALGATVPFLRPAHLSEDYIDISDVLAYSLEKIEEASGIVDLVVVMHETYPFRPQGMLDEMIHRVINDGLDTLLATRKEPRKLWLAEDNDIKQIGDDAFIPRNFQRKQIQVGLMGLGCVTHPSFIRDHRIIGDKLGLYPVTSPLSTLEIRDKDTLKECLPLITTLSAQTNPTIGTTCNEQHKLANRHTGMWSSS